MDYLVVMISLFAPAKTPAEKMKKINLWFRQSLCRKKTSRFWEPRKTNQEHRQRKRIWPIKTTANRNASQNLEADFGDSTKPTWNYASGESAAKRKWWELENPLTEKIWNQSAHLKSATVEAGTYFYDSKTAAAKNGFAFYLQLKTKLVLQRWFCICSWLPNGLRYPQVGGRGQCLRCRKNSKPEKCL